MWLDERDAGEVRAMKWVLLALAVLQGLIKGETGPCAQTLPKRRIFGGERVPGEQTVGSQRAGAQRSCAYGLTHRLPTGLAFDGDHRAAVSLSRSPAIYRIPRRR